MQPLTFAALPAFAACLAPSETTVLGGPALLDGTGRTPVVGAAMVIVDGRITFIGPPARLKVPAGAHVTHLAGKFVMPGIINLHGHLGNTLDLAQDPKNYTAENVEKQLKLYASYA